MKVAYLVSLLGPIATLAASYNSTSPSLTPYKSVPASIATTCSTTKYYSTVRNNGTAYNATTILYDVTCPATTTKTVVAPTYAVFTPAPWLASLPQTTVIHVETIVIAQSTLYRSFSFAVPAPSAAVVANNAVPSACPVARTVTVTSCPTTFSSLGQPGTGNGQPGNGNVPVPGTAVAAPTNAARTSAVVVPGGVATTRVVTSAKTQVSTITSFSAATSYTTKTIYYTITGLTGTTTTSSVSVATVVSTSTIVKPITITVTVTETIVNSLPAIEGQTSNSAAMQTIPESLQSTTKITTQSVLYSNSTLSSASQTIDAGHGSSLQSVPTSSAGQGTQIIVPGQPGTAPTTSMPSSSTIVVLVSSSSSPSSPSSSFEAQSFTSASVPESSSTESVFTMALSASTSQTATSTESIITMAISSATTSETVPASTSSESSSSASNFLPLSTSSASLSSSTGSASSYILTLSSSVSSSSFIASPTTTSSQSSQSSSSSGVLTLSSSSSSSSSAACPIGTLAASATAPAPPAGTNVYNIPGNAPYSISEADLLSQISFPNGYNCRNKLVILQPGTAVPAIDTFSNTFIPAFENAETMAETGGVDIMLISNPTISLGPAWQTAEYVAYALDYANLVLQRPGTIIAWSQGNLNVQWAFKYWPSTRTDVPGRNYVAMSADYDGTIEATFLCQPISILTGDSGAALLDQFITDGGLASVLGAIGISGVPTDASGLTDPDAFRALLLALVFGNGASVAGPLLGSSPSSSSVSSSPFSMKTTTSAEGATTMTLSSASSSSSVMAGNILPTDLPFGKRAVPFGNKDAVIAVLRAEVEKRQTTPIGALGTLLAGVSDSILNELASIIIDPTQDIMQIFANLAKLATDPVNFSVLPKGCNPGVWDQTYGSPFVTRLAENGGALAYVPTTSIYSLTDEVVQPQGTTGREAASAYMPGSNAGVVAPENIYIQSFCSVISNVLQVDAPPLITHEGVLASGMGVAAAILAVISQSTVSYADIVARYGSAEACALVSQRLTAADYLGNEATIPGALLRITVNPGTMDPSAQFVPEPYALPAYAT